MVTLTLVGARKAADTVHDAVAAKYVEVQRSQVGNKWIYHFRTDVHRTSDGQPLTLAPESTGTVEVTISSRSVDGDGVGLIADEITRGLWTTPTQVNPDNDHKFTCDPSRIRS
ncbi:hypothetical protein [Streptacidiphilus sp. PAMC 29251]